MQIGAFVITPIIKKWFDLTVEKLNGFVICCEFTDIKMLLNNIESIDKLGLTNYILFIDIENEFHKEYMVQIKALGIDVKLISVGYPKDVEEIKLILLEGFNGHIDITDDESEFLFAINFLKKNKFFLPKNKIDALISSFIQQESKTEDSILSEKIEEQNTDSNFELTNKEFSVLSYLIKGYSYKQIAIIIGLSTFAVNRHTKSIYKKYGVNSRNELSYRVLK